MRTLRGAQGQRGEETPRPGPGVPVSPGPSTRCSPPRNLATIPAKEENISLPSRMALFRAPNAPGQEALAPLCHQSSRFGSALPPPRLLPGFICVCLYRGGAGSSSPGRCLSLPMVGEGQNPPGAAARAQPTASPACVYRNKRLLARPGGGLCRWPGGLGGCPALLGGFPGVGHSFGTTLAARDPPGELQRAPGVG